MFQTVIVTRSNAWLSTSFMNTSVLIWLEIEKFSYPSIENKLVNFIAKVSISFLAWNDLMYQASNVRGHVYVC